MRLLTRIFALLALLVMAPTFAAATPVAIKCGEVINSTVLVEEVATATNSTSFSTIPGASVTVTVPDGVKRCVKVLFTGETDCASSFTATNCQVRARVGTSDMRPTGSGSRDFGSAKDGSGARAYQWVSVVSGPGKFVVTLQIAVSSSSATFRIDDWSMDVEVSHFVP